MCWGTAPTWQQLRGDDFSQQRPRGGCAAARRCGCSRCCRSIQQPRQQQRQLWVPHLTGAHPNCILVRTSCSKDDGRLVQIS